MHYKLWFTLVGINILGLFTAFFTKSTIISALSLLLALYLQRLSSKVNFPELKIFGHTIFYKENNLDIDTKRSK